MRRAASAEGLAEALKALAGLGREDLVTRWVALYGAAPPLRTSRALMIRAIAYKMQERVHGGLSTATRRMLTGNIAPATAVLPRDARPGTVLLREWHGVTHQVTIVEGGVLHRGKLHRSLSEVARTITGARWSGPTFFGLKTKGQHDPA